MLNPETIEAMARRADTAAQQVHLPFLAGLVELCPQDNDDVRDALALMQTYASTTVTLAQDVQMLVLEVQRLREAVRIWEQLEAVRNETT